ncbi:peptidoglycan-binding protein LysM [Inquilinus limosus]|uniref:Potassium binding protein Kbp n=1 Tax=Inquilinus limosus TaxID=171674 RepID=A0A211YV66_9PROT|nr:peptidoglycan-binding protein LysM [Inquilinus limosus]OWJ56879.1 peptidoglycan-binding protein LysM [Inquilinus limosus]
MGLISFIKGAGEKLFGGGEAEAATADDLKKQIQAQGLDPAGVDIKVEGDKVTVGGNVASTEVAEKIALAVGNTPGVAQVQNDLAAAAPAPESRFYTVKKGDTLSAIAKAEYGNANDYPKIFEANKPMLKHPDKIYPGQVLRIP